MKTKRIISLLLAVLMLAGAFAVTAYAEEGAVNYEYTSNTSNAKPTIDYINGITLTEDPTVKGEAVDTKEKKLATMDLKLAKDGYLLYVDAYSGEVAVKCEATGEILFTNPYNVAYKGAARSEKEKKQLLSQLVVEYMDLATGTNATFYSYTDAATKGQIDLKNIKNGIRIEYAIGREQSRMLVPCLIKKETFEKKIMAPLQEAIGGTYKYDQIMVWFRPYDPETAINKEQLYKDYPITKEMAVYALDKNISEMKKAWLEQQIKTYCPDYSYEDLDADHLETRYESEDKDPPLFKMALEYTLDKDGLSVRLPANGIRFSESLYQLEHIDILPYMGAGLNPDEGYTFFPDGSGAIFDFQTIDKNNTPVHKQATIYGRDYAYHSIQGTHEEPIRYPVFGVVETEKFDQNGVQILGEVAPANEGAGTDTEGGEADTATVITEKDRGFFAIIEEGDALMELISDHAVREHEYNTVIMRVNPRPKDTYNMADAISVGNNAEWTVVSSRKYTGSYKIKYIMLTDKDVASEKGIADFYDCTYVGMAKAYRKYLESAGVLTRLTEEDVSDSIPLFIETFGAIETTERFLTIPISTMVPLTSFENIKTMYKQLSAKNVGNINFVLKGYAEGGMSAPTVPYDLDWESAVGGEDGFRDLLADAKEKGYGIFPDFDFAYAANDNWFDGFLLDDHAVKTIDNRYASKKVYSATKQSYISYFEMAISPAYYSRFYEELTSNYLEFGEVGISVSTLGEHLNSDFDEDEPYNREDAKEFTSEAFKYFDENYSSVMTSKGNAFTWKYVDYIRDIALDSSRYAESAASVPFIGMVLHGYIEFAGEPINMEGNPNYAILKAIESGANLNFILSYQNTELLKRDEQLNQYYSIRYDIWFNDVVEMYNELNSALSGVQTSIIVGHDFVEGDRVPDSDELYRDAVADLEAAIALEEKAKIDEYKNEQKQIMTARKGIIENASKIQTVSERVTEDFDTVNALDIKSEVDKYYDLKADYDSFEAREPALKLTFKTSLDKLINNAKASLEESEDNAAFIAMLEGFAADFEEDMLAFSGVVTSTEEKMAAYEAEPALYALITEMVEKAKALDYTALGESVKKSFNTIVTRYENVYFYADSIGNQKEEVKKIYEKSVEYLAYLKENSELTAEHIADLEQIVKDSLAMLNGIADMQKGAAEAANKAYKLVKDIEGIDAKEYNFEPKTEEPKPEEEKKTETEDISKYALSNNKIVVVTYENGTSFVLNFNDFMVTANVNGTKYTVDSYGYIMFKK